MDGNTIKIKDIITHIEKVMAEFPWKTDTINCVMTLSKNNRSSKEFPSIPPKYNIGYCFTSFFLLFIALFSGVFCNQFGPSSNYKCNQ